MVCRIVLALSLAIAASASRQPVAPGSVSFISAKCKEEVKAIQNKEKATAISACEEKAKYPQQAVAHLQKGDRSAAIKTIEESFQTCAKFSEPCAKELAPQVIQQLEFSGAAVSVECRQTVAKIQSDEKKMKASAKCEQDAKVVENVLTSLNKNDLKNAVAAAHKGLEKCMGLSERCASQLAPVVVNQVVMRAMMEQQKAKQQVPTTTVFARVSAAVLAPQTDKNLSLIGAALDQRAHTVVPKKTGFSFLQMRHLPQRFVSRMLMQMAR